MVLSQTPTTTTTPAKPSWTEMLQQAVPAAMQLYRERQATKMQMERARAGLPPLPVEFYSPPVRVEAGVDKRTMLLLAGIGAAGVLGFLLMGRRRRA